MFFLKVSLSQLFNSCRVVLECNLCVFQVLNEVVVDRGPSSYLSNVDLFLDGHLITTVQGDGEKLVSSSRRWHHFILRNMDFQFDSVVYFCAISSLSATVCMCVCPIRPHRFYTYRKYRVCCGSWGFHDSSQRPRHHDHPYLPSLPLL